MMVVPARISPNQQRKKLKWMHLNPMRSEKQISLRKGLTTFSFIFNYYIMIIFSQAKGLIKVLKYLILTDNGKLFPFYIYNILCNYLLPARMKVINQRKDIEQYHSQCVCQTCTCTKHKCPASQITFPLGQISSYQAEYHDHPINLWKKPPPQQPKPYQPYGDIPSNYKTSYPGHKPQLREKLVPRVKNDNKNVPFEGQSQYKNQFPGKRADLEKPFNKDRMYAPDKTPFEGTTTYTDGYPKKKVNPHEKKVNPDYQFPDGYGFNGSTTYGNSFQQKPLEKGRSYKPQDRLPPSRTHDLGSIYRDDFTEKKLPDVCPILKMPERQKKVLYPHQHLVYNKNYNKWVQK